MKGLELAERFYRASADELFYGLDDIRARHAAGLVGEGSECFGFDDEISRDHDWGPGFCVWLSEEDWRAGGALLQERYERLAARGFGGFTPRPAPERATTPRRVGVFPIGGFYEQLLGRTGAPATLAEWLAISETGLACAVNGRVFQDDLGAFTEMRHALEGYFPEDVRLHKIANGCMLAAQAGQYNFIRQARRGEDAAAFLSLARFAEAALQACFALARRYQPFYKWAPRALRETGPFGEHVVELLDEVVSCWKRAGCKEWQQTAFQVEAVCAGIVEELVRQGLSDGGGDAFLVPHAVQANARIQDGALRRSDLMA